jgi:hypothetical protein
MRVTPNVYMTIGADPADAHAQAVEVAGGPDFLVEPAAHL